MLLNKGIEKVDTSILTIFSNWKKYITLDSSKDRLEHPNLENSVLNFTPVFIRVDPPKEFF